MKPNKIDHVKTVSFERIRSRPLTWLRKTYRQVRIRSKIEFKITYEHVCERVLKTYRYTAAFRKEKKTEFPVRFHTDAFRSLAREYPVSPRRDGVRNTFFVFPSVVVSRPKGFGIGGKQTKQNNLLAARRIYNTDDCQAPGSATRSKRYTHDDATSGRSRPRGRRRRFPRRPEISRPCWTHVRGSINDGIYGAAPTTRGRTAYRLFSPGPTQVWFMRVPIFVWKKKK